MLAAHQPDAERESERAGSEPIVNHSRTTCSLLTGVAGRVGSDSARSEGNASRSRARAKQCDRFVPRTAIGAALARCETEHRAETAIEGGHCCWRNSITHNATPRCDCRPPLPTLRSPALGIDEHAIATASSDSPNLALSTQPCSVSVLRSWCSPRAASLHRLPHHATPLTAALLARVCIDCACCCPPLACSWWCCSA